MSANLVKAMMLAGVLSCLVFSTSCTRVASCSREYWYYVYMCQNSIDTIRLQGNVPDSSGMKKVIDSLENYKQAGYQVIPLLPFDQQTFCYQITGKKCIDEAENNGFNCGSGNSGMCASSSSGCN